MPVVARDMTPCEEGLDVVVSHHAQHIYALSTYRFESVCELSFTFTVQYTA